MRNRTPPTGKQAKKLYGVDPPPIPSDQRERDLLAAELADLIAEQESEKRSDRRRSKVQKPRRGDHVRDELKF